MNWLTEWKREPFHKKEYAKFGAYAQSRAGFCWACGADNRSQPKTYFAPWMIQRCHIVSKPRLEDRRAVVLLCPVCHFDEVHRKKTLSIENLLWLKRLFDPNWFCLEFLQKCSIRRIQQPLELPAAFVSRFMKTGLTRGKINA